MDDVNEPEEEEDNPESWSDCSSTDSNLEGYHCFQPPSTYSNEYWYRYYKVNIVLRRNFNISE
jgi:hypothetical protein